MALSADAILPGHTLPALTHPQLEARGVRHGFFTREGGVSDGVYASLNAGPGSADDLEAVAENHRRIAAHLGCAGSRVVTMHQTHSADVAVLSEAPAVRPRVDGVVTSTPGLIIGALAADCAPVLFVDPQARVIAAAHAGWRGALGGVLEATVTAMEDCGAERGRIVTVVGPCIAQPSYEVGAEFEARFVEADASNARFFAPAARPGHAQFDLTGYVVHRLSGAGVGFVSALGLDTYADEARFFSYRRATHRGETDYGRLLSAIVLAD